MGGFATSFLLHGVRKVYPLRCARNPASIVMYAHKKICDTLYMNLMGYGSIAGRNGMIILPKMTKAT